MRRQRAMPTNDSTTELFFSLIRCGIGKEKELPRTPSMQEWEQLFDISKKQTLAGITFNGIQALPQEQRPQGQLLLQWYSISESIKKKNIELTKKAIAVSKKFKAEGFDNCILKGQGVAQYYPIPELRTPGDIDIWLNGDTDSILSYIKGITPDCKPKYHHVDFDIMPGLDIEVHYRPTWMCNSRHNKKLQKFFTNNRHRQFANTVTTAQGELAMPSAEFNRIYIPIHIFRHLFDEGIGLRQILDYHFILIQGTTHEEKAICQALFKQFGIKRFMQALMYVMQEVFKLNNEHLIIEPNEREGKFLLHEILIAGNFGQYDSRYKEKNRGYNPTRIIELSIRLFRLVIHYPSEALWNPIFRTWHYFWRKRKE